MIFEIDDKVVDKTKKKCRFYIEFKKYEDFMKYYTYFEKKRIPVIFTNSIKSRSITDVWNKTSEWFENNNIPIMFFQKHTRLYCASRQYLEQLVAYLDNKTIHDIWSDNKLGVKANINIPDNWFITFVDKSLYEKSENYLITNKIPALWTMHDEFYGEQFVVAFQNKDDGLMFKLKIIG